MRFTVISAAANSLSQTSNPFIFQTALSNMVSQRRISTFTQFNATDKTEIMFFKVPGGKKSMHAQGEHADSTKKGLDLNAQG